MGTRGFITFVIDGEEKTAYNHFDSYPDALGLAVLGWLRDALKASTEETAGAARRLRVMDPRSVPTADDVDRLARFSWNSARHGGSRDLREGQEWYDLLHEAQGKPDLILEAGVIEDAKDFPRNSLFAEYGYVIDFDRQQFEAYEGFQKSPHDKGRFASREPIGHTVAGTYYPVALMASWPFDGLPSDRDFTAALCEDDGDEDE